MSLPCAVGRGERSRPSHTLSRPERGERAQACQSQFMWELSRRVQRRGSFHPCKCHLHLHHKQSSEIPPARPEGTALAFLFGGGEVLKGLYPRLYHKIPRLPPSLRPSMNPGYLYAEAEREGHGDDDEQDGKGRQNEGSDARVAIVGCKQGKEKRGNQLTATRGINRVGRGREGEQCNNVREIRST